MNGHCGNLAPHHPHSTCDGPPRIEGGGRGGWTCLATDCTQPAVDRNLCVKCGRWAA